MNIQALSYKAALGNDTSKWLSLAKEAGIFAAIAALTTIVGALETESAIWAPTAVALLGLLVSYLRKLVGTSTVPTAVSVSVDDQQLRLLNQILNEVRYWSRPVDVTLKERVRDLKRGVLANLPDLKIEPPEERALKGGGLTHDEWLSSQVCTCGQPATELHRGDGDYVPLCEKCHTEAHNTKENQ